MDVDTAIEGHAMLFSAICAGGEMASGVTQEPAGPLLPAGTTGIRNIGKQPRHSPLLPPCMCPFPVFGLADRQAWPLTDAKPLVTDALPPAGRAGNTCFVNAALQCLRYTPGLPLQVVPDLLQRAAEQPQEQERQATGAGSEAAAEPAAGGEAQLQAQEEGEEAAAPATEDVHQQALARASVDLSAEEVERARLALGQAAAAAGGAAEGGAADAATAAGDAAAAAAAPEEAAAAAPAAEGAEAEADAPATEQPAVAAAAPQPQAAAKPQRPPKGALLEAFAALVQELYLKPATGPAVCAAPMLRTLRAFPIAGASFTRQCLQQPSASSAYASYMCMLAHTPSSSPCCFFLPCIPPPACHPPMPLPVPRPACLRLQPTTLTGGSTTARRC